MSDCTSGYVIIVLLGMFIFTATLPIGSEMNNIVARIGYWSALVAFVAVSGYDAAQILQLLGFLKYPLDAVLIYGFSLGIAAPFMLAMLALHYTVPDEKKIWSHAGVLFSVIYVTYVTLNYVVQLATVIPMTLIGALDEIRVLDQTPHSLFWDIDALGYIFLGLATMFTFPVFARGGFDKWVRRFFLANGLITPVITFVYFYPDFSTTLLLLGSPWIITATGSMLFLALFFKRRI